MTFGTLKVLGKENIVFPKYRLKIIIEIARVSSIQRQLCACDCEAFAPISFSIHSNVKH